MVMLITLYVKHIRSVFIVCVWFAIAVECVSVILMDWECFVWGVWFFV